MPKKIFQKRNLNQVWKCKAHKKIVTENKGCIQSVKIRVYHPGSLQKINKVKKHYLAALIQKWWIRISPAPLPQFRPGFKRQFAFSPHSPISQPGSTNTNSILSLFPSRCRSCNVRDWIIGPRHGIQRIKLSKWIAPIKKVRLFFLQQKTTVQASLKLFF